MSVFETEKTVPATSVPKNCPLSELCHRLVEGQPFPCGKDTAEQATTLNLASQLAAKPCSPGCLVSRYSDELRAVRIRFREARHLKDSLSH